MSFKLSNRSLERLNGLHPDIVAVIRLAIQKTEIDFTVLEGLRSIDRQRELFAQGASKTMNSRHLTGHAVDIAPFVDGDVSWHWPHYDKLAPAIKSAASELGVNLEWGGDWQSFKDGPHWQLSWDEYGKSDMAPRAVGVESTGPIPNAVVQIKTPAPAPKPIAVPREVAAVLDDADKGMSSTTNWGALVGVAGSAYAGFQSADPMVQAALLLVGAVLIYVLRERIRKAKLGRLAKEVLG